MTIFANAAGYSRFVPNYTENLGIALSGGTFSVQGARAALSQDNAAYVGIQDVVAPGLQRVYRVIANQTFTDGSAGTTDNQRFGLLTGNVWGANDIPFFLYAVENDAQTAVAFMISRNPAAQVAPAAASIGKSGAVVNVDQNDFFSLANITVGDYDGNPCTYIGCFRMRFVGATDSWTVQTLVAGTDGIGMNFNNKLFNFPVAVQGAAAGSFFLANGGTAPIYTTQQITYGIYRSGTVLINVSLETNSTAGAGAVNAIMTIPYTQSVVGFPYKGASFFTLATTVETDFIPISNGSPQPNVLFVVPGNAGVTTNPTFGASTKYKATFEYGPYMV